MNAMHRVFFSLVLGVVLTAQPVSAAEGMLPIQLGEPFAAGWVPETREPLRGILYLDGMMTEPRWMEACRIWRFAMVRTATYGYGDGSSQRLIALRRAVSELARRTGHPELVNVPLLTTGFSRHSSFPQQLCDVWPNGVIAHANGFGPRSADGPGRSRSEKAWTVVPSLYMATEFEDFWVGDSIRTPALPYWRRFPEMLRGMCLTRGTRHNPFNHHELALVFFDRVIAHRLPADWDPRTGPPTLRPMALDSGWMGSHENFHKPELALQHVGEPLSVIAPYADFTYDRTDASWLPDSVTAHVWQAFSIGRPLVNLVQPGHVAMTHVPTTLHVEWHHSSDRPVPLLARVAERSVTAIEFWAGDRQIAVGSPLAGGALALGDASGATSQAEALLPPGVHGIFARYTLSDGSIGLSRPVTVVVHPPGFEAAE